MEHIKDIGKTVSVVLVDSNGTEQIYHLDIHDNNTLLIGDNFTQQLVQQYGMNMLYWSALQFIDGEKILREFLSMKPIDTAIEIGTAKGATTALMAHYANKVYTIDQIEFLIARVLWSRYGLEDKIKFIRAPTDNEKIDKIAPLYYDFAFIDGEHTNDGVRLDFEIVKNCGRVLFHDYSDDALGVKEFIDTLPKEELTIKDRYAYWEKK